MKETFNSIKVLLLACLIAFGFTKSEAEAQTVVGNTFPSLNAVTNLNQLMGIPTNGIIVTKVTIAVPSAATSNATFFFYDWFVTANGLIYTNIYRYTNATVVDPYTNSVVFTNSLGQTATNSYVGRGVFYTNGIATNTTSSVPAIGAITVSPGTTYTLDVNWNVALGLGLRATNNNPLAFITIEYH